MKLLKRQQVGKNEPKYEWRNFCPVTWRREENCDGLLLFDNIQFPASGTDWKVRQEKMMKIRIIIKKGEEEKYQGKLSTKKEKLRKWWLVFQEEKRKEEKGREET